MVMLSHATLTGSIFPSINAGRAYVGENITFPLQDKIDRHCTQPMSEIITPHTRIQQFETERTFPELDDTGVELFVGGLAATGSLWARTKSSLAAYSVRHGHG
jgi:hypothetical protein